MPSRLSQTDAMILDLLKQDARRTISQIAGIVGLSRATVKQRIDLMRERGVIKRFTVETEELQPIGPGAERTFFLVRLKRPHCKQIYSGIRHWPELLGCWSIAGELDMIVLVSAISNGEVDRMRDVLARHPDIAGLQTMPALRDWLEDGQVRHSGR